METHSLPSVFKSDVTVVTAPIGSVASGASCFPASSSIIGTRHHFKHSADQELVQKITNLMVYTGFFTLKKGFPTMH